MTKVLVIGGGIAGYCAALAARRDGAEVTLVAKAPGASALYAGGMEVVDDLDAILAQQRHHPITRLGLDSVRLASELDIAIHTLQIALEKRRPAWDLRPDRARTPFPDSGYCHWQGTLHWY